MATREQLVITSFHEAGHAVMAMSAGFMVTELSCVTSADGQGHVIWQPPQLTTNGSHVASVLAYTAGMAADFLHWKATAAHDGDELCIGAQDDQAKAQKHLITLGHQDFFEDYLAFSIGHLQKPDVWSWVEFLAQTLRVTGVINGQDVLCKAWQDIPKISHQELEFFWLAIERKLTPKLAF